MAKQTRINNTIRAHIVEKAMADAFDQRMKNLKICTTAFADNLYECHVNHLALIAKKLPSGWVSYSNRITISFHEAVFTLTHQYATVEKLLEGWPEGVKYVPQTTAATIFNIAPVGLLDEVRRILAQGKVE